MCDIACCLLLFWKRLKEAECQDIEFYKQLKMQFVKIGSLLAMYNYLMECGFTTKAAEVAADIRKLTNCFDNTCVDCGCADFVPSTTTTIAPSGCRHKLLIYTSPLNGITNIVGTSGLQFNFNNTTAPLGVDTGDFWKLTPANHPTYDDLIEAIINKLNDTNDAQSNLLKQNYNVIYSPTEINIVAKAAGNYHLRVMDGSNGNTFGSNGIIGNFIITTCQ